MIKDGIQFVKDREFQNPYTSGIMMDDLSIDEMRSFVAELTASERKSPWAEYYFDRMPVMTPEQQAAFDTPLCPEQMYMPSEAGKIMLERQDEYPTLGYGVMENGIGYAAIRIDQTGMTDDMVREYREGFARDPENRDLFYKCWFPGRHIVHFEDGVIEDFGYGAMVLRMNFGWYSLKHAGITPEYIDEKSPDALEFMLLGGKEYMLWAPEKTQNSMMMRYTKEVPGGRVSYIHFYNGLIPNEDGTCTPDPSGSKKEVEMKMRCQYFHCLSEYYHELMHMKMFWNMNHPDRKVEI